MERLQKVLAHAGVASRRACEAIITAGRVTVNGQVVSELGAKVDPSKDAVAIDGKPVAVAPAPVYLMLNKPPGYVSTTHDPHAQRTVLELVTSSSTARLYPVGRLDAASEGLLLLTNDGTLTERLTHPRYGVEKEYHAWIEGVPSAAELARLRSGIPLDGQVAAVDNAEILSRDVERSRTVLRIVVHEGRKHEVRRLCEAMGYAVSRLQRVRIGALELGDLPVAASRPLTQREVTALMALTPHQPKAPTGAGGPGGSAPTRREHERSKKSPIHHRH